MIIHKSYIILHNLHGFFFVKKSEIDYVLSSKFTLKKTYSPTYKSLVCR